MKRSQSDEERTQQERYDAEISYRFTSKIAIAQTKTSTVFRVTDTSGTIYALKELNPCFLSKKKELQRAALIEYKHAKSLRIHPNILRYDTYWQFGPYICFQMEYIPGSSLERYLRENSLYDPVLGHEKDIVWKFLFDLLNGLSYMHQKNIVHLDIKPSNILMCPRSANNIPTLKIGDFGLSRILGSETGDERFKKGDGKYLAPELLDSKSYNITTAVDIFSLGITVYEMASDYTATDVLWTSVINDTISYDKISKDLKILLARMLCKEPSWRISAADCLLLNENLRNLHNEYGCDFATLNNNHDDSNEEMEDVFSGLDQQMSQSQSAQSYSKIGKSSASFTTNEESIKPNLVAIRKKLF